MLGSVLVFARRRPACAEGRSGRHSDRRARPWPWRSPALRAGAVVAAGVAHHHRGRRVEAVDQEAGLVVDREGEGALNRHGARCFSQPDAASTSLRKISGSSSASMKPNWPTPSSVALRAELAELRRDAAHHLGAAFSEEKLDLGVLEIGVLLRVQVLEAFEIELGDEVLVIRIEAKGRSRKACFPALSLTGRMVTDSLMEAA